MSIRSFFKSIFAFAALTSCTTKASNEVVPTNDDVILHAWCWSFNSIRENLKDIAEAGYTIVQTSPAQHCITNTESDPEGGNKLFGNGFWYYHYQPTDWKIGNQHVGTRDDLIALCNEAKKYGIRIIVDVLPNHTAIDQSKVEPDLDAAVGGHENLYHANGLTPIEDYNDRLQCTTGEMGGLPDVNTEIPDFQAYYMTYVNDLLACGVRGFRYDTAKHIGLPSDPLDPKAKQNDFWDVAMGRKSVKGVHLAIPADELYIYGEVLQDKNVKEEEYAEYMGLTASSMGWNLRKALHEGRWNAGDVVSFSHKAAPEKLVTWVESHDTYCNEHESASLTNEQLRAAWAYLAARQNGTPLFYNRPDGSDGPSENYWGNNIAGVKGNDEFKNPVVAEANKFRRAMSGCKETLSFAKRNTIAQIARGSKGATFINVSPKAAKFCTRTPLADGTYQDKVSGENYTVKRGRIRGTLPAYGIVILYM